MKTLSLLIGQESCNFKETTIKQLKEKLMCTENFELLLNNKTLNDGQLVNLYIGGKSLESISFKLKLPRSISLPDAITSEVETDELALMSCKHLVSIF